MAASRIKIWEIILYSYNHELVVHSRVKYRNIDSMSRQSFQSDNIEKGLVLENQVSITELCNSSPLTSVGVAKHSARDPIISIVIEYIKNDWP